MAKKSRLNKSYQKKSRYTFIFSVLAIIIILVLLFRYGIPLLSDASFFFGRLTNTSTDEIANSEDEMTFVPVPRLDSLPNSTNEENLTIEGASLPGLSIAIHLNGSFVEEIDTDENGHFEYDLTLTDGANLLKINAIKEGEESDFSRTHTITLTAEGPELSIKSPSNNSEVKGENPFEIKGKSDPGARVTVNDFQAILNSSGEWSYFLTLVDGDNEIKIISVDSAGNKTEESIQINYSP